MSDRAAQVAILMGSDSDWEVMSACADRLTAFGIRHDVRVMSAHRTPKRVAEYVTSAGERNIQVFVVGAGAAAHLAGVVAAHTTLPVIGVPLSATDLNGLDALLATVQMPAGVPVATVAIGKSGAENAAILAAQILALRDAALSAKLLQFKQDMAAKVEDKDRALQKKITAAAKS